VLHGLRPRIRGRLTLLACAALAFALAPGEALAATGFKDKTPLPGDVVSTSTTTATQHASSGSGGGAFVRMIVGLLVVIGVIYGVYWLLKTYGKSKKQETGDGRMEVVATTQLAPNRAVHLVKVGDELVLVGSGEQAITQLRVYDADESQRLTDLLISPPDLRPLDGDGGGSKGLTIGRLVDDLRRKTARQ
jgi:flagellar protein FliO/FliZ